MPTNPIIGQTEKALSGLVGKLMEEVFTILMRFYDLKSEFI
jgi:hypothetical protein